MKHLLLLSVLLTCALAGRTQQYFVSSTSGSNNYPFNNTSGNKVAWLYLPGDFGTPPTGTITDIYFAVSSSVSNASFTNFTVKMGLTSQTAWTSSTYPATGLTTVISGNPYVIPSVAPTWLKLTLQTPFAFDGTSSIIVLVESQSFSNGFTVYQNSTTGRRIYGSYGNATGSGFDGTYAGFGFDIQTCPSPVFSGQPQNKNVCEGTNTSFSLTASNASFYQWQVNTGSGFTNVSNGGNYSGATTSTLNLSMVPASFNNYQYRCIVTGACNNPVNSGTATLTIMPGASIVTQTLNRSVCETAPIDMDISAFGSITGYQWQMAVGTVGVFSDVPNSYPFSGTTTQKLDIVSTPKTLDGYQFRCVVSAVGQCSGATSTPIPLTVLAPPLIDQNGPVSTTVQPYSDATFSIAVNGSSYGPFWQASADGLTYSNINDNALYAKTKTSQLTVKNPPVAMANWWFRCIIKSTDQECGLYYDTSSSAQLKIVDPNSINNVEKSGNIAINPNPVSGNTLWLTNNGSDKIRSGLSITDATGKLVYSSHTVISAGQKAPVDISNLVPGIYLINLLDKDGETHSIRFTRQ